MWLRCEYAGNKVMITSSSCFNPQFLNQLFDWSNFLFLYMTPISYTKIEEKSHGDPSF